jgi:DnaJ-class molecular chaperone
MKIIMILQRRVKEILCHICNGTGEIIEEPGGDGYLPLYCNCDECKGSGYIIHDKSLEYKE